MISRMKARYSKGVIVPLEAHDLEEGSELFIDVSVAPSRSDEERMKRTMSAAGGWKGRHDPEELKRRLYEARLAGSKEKPVI